MSVSQLPSSLHAIARRHVGPGEADDVVQEALLAAIEAGRTDFSSGETRAWLAGVIRNKARMAGRSAGRRRAREAAWQAGALGPGSEHAAATRPDLSSLSPALRLTALLALNGATRGEIAWLLGLSDAALRQRIAQLKRALARLPDGSVRDGLKGALPFGTLRRRMLARLRHRGGFLASHDPDGHLFLVTRSQNGLSRQQEGEPLKRRTL